MPKNVPPEVAAAIIKLSMGNNYGYTPADAAQDLKNAEGKVVLKYNNIRIIENTVYIS